MRILVACEESQAVTIELRKLGHEAYSCDIIECSGGHPEWHIQWNALHLLNGRCRFFTMDGVRHELDGKWDMIIAFPPCTYLTNAGARHLWKGHQLNQDRYQKGLQAKEFFMAFLNADCPMIAVENPTPSKIYDLPKPSQTIQPWQFGHPYTKRTNLWLKGLPPLWPTELVEPIATWCPSGSYSGEHNEKHRGMFTKDRARNRSKTFPGIAKAMAEQWAGQQTPNSKEESPMAKLLTIKINNAGDVDIKSHLPDGMTEAEMNEHLTIALPMATACLAEEMSEGNILAARAGLLAMYELADRLLTKKMKEDDCDDTCCCESDADPDD